MVIDIETGLAIEQVPFRREFDVLRSRLSDADFEAMVARINELIDAGGSGDRDSGLAPGERSDRHSVRAPRRVATRPSRSRKWPARRDSNPRPTDP